MALKTITSFQLTPDWHYGGSTGKLRLYYSDSLVDSEGRSIIGGAVGSQGFYKEVDITIASLVATVAQFQLVTTEDSDHPNAKVTGVLYDSSGSRRDTLFEWSVPSNSTITSPNTFAVMEAYNDRRSPLNLPVFYQTQPEVLALINARLAALGFGPATDLVQGIVLLSQAAPDPSSPRVWEFSDSRVRDALKFMGVELDATMASPAVGNAPVFNAGGKWEPGVPTMVPAPHAVSHQSGGSDEMSLAGMTGLLATAQIPVPHAVLHENGGADEILIDGLSGLAADPQTPLAHKTSHENGGSDEISVTGLSGLLADAQNPLAHVASHQNGGADELSVTGLSGVLAEAQIPLAHAASHQNGGADEVSVSGLSGVLADPQVANTIVESSGPTLLAVGAVANGEFLQRAGSTVIGGTPSGVAPGGPAGGDLSGTYPNPTVAKVAGVTPEANVATFLGAPSSANLAAALTDETGSGAAVFATSPVFTTDITLPNGSSPTTGSVAKIAFDTDAWGASRGAMQVHDGTANTYVVAVLASDAPSNGQVPTWNTGGTITWETPAASITPLQITDANTIEQYNSTNAQSLSVYKTRTDASNYERLKISSISGGNPHTITSEAAGSGTVRDLTISSGTANINLNSGNPLTIGGTATQVIPSATGTISLGSSTRAWSNVFSVNLFATTAGSIGFNGGAGATFTNGASGTGATTFVYNATWAGAIRNFTASSGSTNNPDFGTAAYLYRISPNAAGSTLTGGRDMSQTGEVHKVANVGSAQLILANNNSSSSAGRRWLSASNLDLQIAPNQMASYLFDGTTNNIRIGKYSSFETLSVTTQFDKTSNTTLADVTGLSIGVQASRTYDFEAVLYTSSNVAGGVQFAIGGTATATAIVYEAIVFSGAATSAQTRATALATAVGAVTAVTAAFVKIYGTIQVNAAGTLTVQFAQNASNGSASSVLVGSTFRVNNIS